MSVFKPIVWTLLILLLDVTLAWGQQGPDSTFDASVSRPAYGPGPGPVVVIDEGHGNFHTRGGNYSPLARLLENDGYRVRSAVGDFTATSLDTLSLLVIANALADSGKGSAFLPEECEQLRSWVETGGSLLLVADHAPFGKAAAELAQQFDVEMGCGWVFSANAEGLLSLLDFTPGDGLAPDHPITRGRDSLESVTRVRSFTGQSLSGPAAAVVLLRLDEHAREAPGLEDLNQKVAALGETGPSPDFGKHSIPVPGRAQALALKIGKGRVVVLGEAAMLSAQVVVFQREAGPVTIRAGMNVPGIDNRQWALNVFHWLSGLSEPGTMGP